jgi:hypothetical protein
MKKEKFIPIPDGNAAKYFSCRQAWGQIKKAKANGYYVEAIALEESIISDRLLSYLVRIEEIKSDDKGKFHSLDQLIKKWRKRVPGPIKNREFSHLQEAVEKWKGERNAKIHGMAKSAPGTEHQDIIEFKKDAERVAKDGERLAKALQNWYKNFKRQEARKSINFNS